MCVFWIADIVTYSEFILLTVLKTAFDDFNA